MQLTSNINLSQEDRSRNILITSTTGVGMSVYLLDLINQDIKKGNSLIVFDPYGDLANKIIANRNSQHNIAYIDIGNQEYPIGLNLFEVQEENDKREAAGIIINLMYDLYDPNRSGVIGPRFEHAVRNAILTIMYDEKATFIELVRCLTDATYLKNLLPKLKDEIVKSYWTKQVAQTSDFHKSEVLDYVVSKFGPFITDRKMRYILGQVKSTINIEKLLSEGKTIIFDFGKLRSDSEAVKIVSAILMIKLLQVFRKRIGQEKRIVNLFLDEVSFWPSNSIVELLQEGRRYGINLTLTTNKISEISLNIKKELLKAGTLVSFRLNTEDAKVVMPEFHLPSITVDTLCMMKKYHAFLKYLQDGNPTVTSEPMNLEKKLHQETNPQTIDKFKKESSQKYGTHFATVEENIKQRIST